MTRLVRRLAAAFRRPVVRVWKLGSLEHRVIPTEAAVQRLAEMLMKMGDGDTDLIWGPDLEVVEFRGTGRPNVVVGPGIRVTQEGGVLRVEREEAPVPEDYPPAADVRHAVVVAQQLGGKEVLVNLAA